MIRKTCFKGWVWLLSQSFARKQELCTKQMVMFLMSKMLFKTENGATSTNIMFSFYRKVNMRIHFSSLIKKDLKEPVWLCLHKQFFVLRKENWKCDWFFEIRLNLLSKCKHFIWTKISFLIYILQKSVTVFVSTFLKWNSEIKCISGSYNKTKHQTRAPSGSPNRDS